MKKKVTERALIERLRRKLAKKGMNIYKNTRGPYMGNLGEYYVVDLSTNNISHSIDSIEEYSREDGVLNKWEELFTG